MLGDTAAFAVCFSTYYVTICLLCYQGLPRTGTVQYRQLLGHIVDSC